MVFKSEANIRNIADCIMLVYCCLFLVCGCSWFMVVYGCLLLFVLVSFVGKKEPGALSGWKVYPNPTRKNLTVFAPEGDKEGMQVEIRNSLGQVLFTKSDKTGQMDLEMAYPVGHYSVLVRCGSHHKAFNVIKARE